MNRTKAESRQSFFNLAAMLVLGIVLVGFSRTFYLRGAFDFEALPAHLYVHGAVLTAWFVLFLAQVFFVQSHRVDRHKRLGVAGVVLAGAVIVVSLQTVALLDAPVIDEAPHQSLGNVAALFGFALLIGGGVWFRRKPAYHRRLMLLGSMEISAPAIDRIAQIPSLRPILDAVVPDFLGPTQVGFAILGTLTLVGSVFLYDLRTIGRPHRATIAGALCIFVFGPALSAALMFSGAWEAFVRWVT